MKQLSEKLSDCEDELDAVSMDHSACEDLVRDEVVTKISQYNDEVVALEAHIRSGHQLNFFLIPFCENSLICLEGKSMTPHRGNTILFRSSQQLPRLGLGPSKDFLS